eukprot:SM000025S08414  [mRNA]  locus=s25:647539:653302:+ [translate_table: standard]
MVGSEAADLLLVAADGVEGVVAVAGDALVDGEQEEVEAVAVARVEQRQDVRQHGKLAQSGEELGSLLASAASGSKSVAVLAADAAAGDLLANWACYAAELGVLGRAVVVTSSSDLAAELVQRGLHVYLLLGPPPAPGGAAATASAPPVHGSTAFKLLVLERTKFVVDVLRHGYDALITDADTVWLSDPFPHLVGADADVLAQVTDGFWGGGLTLVRSTEEGRKLWDRVVIIYEKMLVEMMRKAVLLDEHGMASLVKSYKSYNEQRCLTLMVGDKVTNAAVKRLSPALFPSGKDLFQPDGPQRQNGSGTAPRQPVVVHVDVVNGIEEKIILLANNGFWRIDDQQRCTCITCRGRLPDGGSGAL